ncbi:MAG: hypothetical protein JST39_20875 [Bacteroidetes bacterium]|nr:hypothetical protein [Bacteroidota bacterium]
MYAKLKRLLLYIAIYLYRKPSGTQERELNDFQPPFATGRNHPSVPGVSGIPDSDIPTVFSFLTSRDNGKHSKARVSSLPSYPVVWAYFIANGYPANEASRFYRQFQIFGWNNRIVPQLENWQEIADYWMQQVRLTQTGSGRKP